MGQTRINSQDLGDSQVTLTDLGALSTTGALISYSNGAHVAFPSGQSGRVLVSDPSNTTGLNWSSTPALTRINDLSGNAILDFAPTLNATEYLRIGNTTSGATTSISLAVAGTATDINIRFVPKGAGDLRVGSATVATTTNAITLTNKTLTTPSIASFVSGNHNHEDSAGGGQLGVAAINAGGTPDSTTFLRGDGQWATPLKGVLSICFKSENIAAWTNMPAALTFFAGNLSYIAKVNLEGYSSGRLLVNRATVAGATDSSLMVRYNRNYSTTASTYSPLGQTTDIIVNVQAASAYDDSNWQRLSSDPNTGDIYIGLFGISGDGALDPQFGNIYAQFI